MHQIVVNDIPVDVVRKKIKNLHLAVYPPKAGCESRHRYR